MTRLSSPCVERPDAGLEAVMAMIQGLDPDQGPPLIGIAGSQGSGKSTLARKVAEALGAAQFSLDDVYLTRAERAAKGEGVHPLFATRGVPGTHDLALLRGTIEALRQAREGDETPLPAFDKLADDRAPRKAWPLFVGRPKAIVVEGWCLGARPQAEGDLLAPLNPLEAEHDPQGLWRRAVNEALAKDYGPLFEAFDAVLFLKAPGFETVLDWRCEQEAGLMGIASKDLPEARRQALAVFIQSFERITRHMLAGGVRADVVVRLDEGRRVLAVT